MPKFKVLAGSHLENGITYEKDQVFDSPHDLIAAFPNKFQLVGETNIAVTNVAPAPAPPPSDSLDNDWENRETDAPDPIPKKGKKSKWKGVV